MAASLARRALFIFNPIVDYLLSMGSGGIHGQVLERNGVDVREGSIFQWNGLCENMNER